MYQKMEVKDPLFDKKVGLMRKVTPRGVLAVVAMSGIVAWMWWTLATGVPSMVRKPPYTQEQLADAVVQCIFEEDKRLFERTLLTTDELEAPYLAALERASESRQKEIDRAYGDAKRVWGPPFDGTIHSFEKVMVAVADDEPSMLEVDDIKLGERDNDYYTGMASYHEFIIHFHSKRVRYTLTVNELRETLDGWKIAGKFHLTKHAIDVLDEPLVN